jgi:hypothetical protein
MVLPYCHLFVNLVFLQLLFSEKYDAVHVRKSTRPEPRQQKIYSALGIGFHPGTTIKTTNKSSAITEVLRI